MQPPKVKSYVGVNDFDTAGDDIGVTFDSVDAPDSPADKAGLVGVRHHYEFLMDQIHDEDQMADLMVNTPIGKTVDVEYLRDGEEEDHEVNDDFSR